MYYTDIKKLQRAGYEVIEQSPWHYQITHNNITVNIWPSKSKYMQEYGSGASHYSDVVEAIKSVVGEAGHKETYAERLARTKAYLDELYPIIIRQPAEKQWRYELDVITNWIHRRVAKAKERREAMDF